MFVHQHSIHCYYSIYLNVNQTPFVALRSASDAGIRGLLISSSRRRLDFGQSDLLETIALMRRRGEGRVSFLATLEAYAHRLKAVFYMHFAVHNETSVAHTLHRWPRITKPCFSSPVAASIAFALAVVFLLAQCLLLLRTC